jgi:hypothetical protein
LLALTAFQLQVSWLRARRDTSGLVLQATANCGSGKCSRKTFRQDRTARKGQPEKDSQDRRTGIGEIEQDNCDGQDNQEINSKIFTEYKDISTLRSLFLPVENLIRNANFSPKKLQTSPLEKSIENNFFGPVDFEEKNR